MLVVGIDPGTATTGYAFVSEAAEDGCLRAVDFGVVLTPNTLPQQERLLIIYRKLSELLALHRPAYGAVEKLFFQRNVTSAIAVGQARGVALLALAEAGVQVNEYSPLEVKQAVAGYGAADKKQMQQMVRLLLGLQEVPQPDDAADALALAICHLHTNGWLQVSR
ncbi:MAG: crossover junction endodeoxyribonuclease RuvC [Anaerolineae bacterium]|nr:crossover junction endodeoxyribonuclease RuvC [Anaerolineae bacterium]